MKRGQLKGGDFTFVLTDLANPDQVVQEVTNDANGVVKFSTMKYKEVGKHSYLVTEKVGTDANMDYDTMSIVVNVDVTKDEVTGNLKTEVKYVSTGGKSIGSNDTEFNNTLTPPPPVVPPTPEFQPEKFDLSVPKFDVTGNKLLDDDSELANKYADTNSNPYADQSNNNEPENINTKELNRGDAIVYQVWLDTTKLTEANKINKLGITDDYDEANVQVSDIKAYDGVTGQDVTHLFDITNENGVITATTKDSLVTDHVIDNNQMPFGRYYKFDIVGTVKADAVAGKDFTNIANQSVQYFNPVKGGNEVPPPKPSEKRVNKVKPAPADIELKVTKKLEGGQLKGGDFTFVLTDLANPDQVVQEVTNDANGVVKFSTMKYKEVGKHSYLVTEKVGTDANMDYDTMSIVVNVDVTKDEVTGNLKTEVKYVSTGGKPIGSNDTEFNNTLTPPPPVVPPTPEFQPEKFDLSVPKFDVTGNKLLDDDSELANKYADTSANPYADQANNNEPENINTKELNRGDAIVYQVWLDTTKLTEANKINKLGITDDYDEASVDVSEIKAYDGVTGQDVTHLFDIVNNNGVITATTKDSLVTDHVIDNNQMPFGRYYKFDIVGTVKADAVAGKDFTNIANQSVQYFNPVKGGNEVPPPKPSEKRVNKVKPAPADIELRVTKKLEGGQLKGGDFTFVLTDLANPDQVVQEVTNDANGVVKFSTMKYKEVGKHSYLVTEKVGTDANMDYDTMSIVVNVDVTKDEVTGNLKTEVKYVSTGGKSIGSNDTEFNNTLTPPPPVVPPTPEFQPEKFDLSVPKFDVTGNKLLDDDSELANKYADTNSNPYADQANNNEPENINTKELNRGDAIVYQVWLDTTKLTEANKINKLGITDDYDESSVDVSEIKAYDGVTGQDVTHLFDITNENGVITATTKASLVKDHVIDNEQMPFGRYYKFDIVGTVKADAVAGKDFTNIANQSVQYFNPVKGGNEVPPPKPSEKRVNKVTPAPADIELKVTKKLEGGQLKGGDFTFVLTDLANPDQVVQEVTNDANGVVKFSTMKYKEVGKHSYLVTEKVGTDANMDYDTMSIVVNVDVTKDEVTGNLKTNVKYVSTGGKSIGANDTEFNNTVIPPTPPTPEFQPEKFDLSVPKFDVTGNKLLDDDSELANKYTDTNSNPYADQSNNNEPENINTKELNRGDAIVYQVWLDTTKLTEANKINKVGITDDYDESSVDVSDIKAYDGVTGQDVTHLFDITNENGVITATSKDSLIKDHVIDNSQMPFGRYYKFDIVGTVKADAVAGKDFTNIANQSVQYFNPVKGGNEVPPPKPSEKRVNKVTPAPADIELKVTKKLEGGQLKGGDFTFVLTDLANPDQVVQEVTNDANGVVKFSTMKYKEVGKHSYLVTEKVGPDTSVDYDTMSVVVNVDVTKDATTGNLKTEVKYVSTGGKSIGANDTEFNNTVKPPTPPHFQPEKFDLSVPKFDLTGNKLLDDDSELANKYTDTNSNPYADQSNNNEPENINTKELSRGDAIVYQVWLDTTKLTAENKINQLGITDDYDEASVDVSEIKAYDGVTGQDVTHLFDIVNNNGVITATTKASLVKDHVIDNEQMPFGRYYKFDIVGKIKADAVAGKDITNVANQSAQFFNPVKGGNEVPPPPPTEKRVNKVKPEPANIELKVTKRLEGGQLKGGDFTFVLTDLANPEQPVQQATNDANGNVKFLPIKYNEVGKHSYLVTEKVGTEQNVDYDTMSIVVNVDVTKDEVTGNLKTEVKYVSTGGKSIGANDTEFNNTITPPPTPEFQPEKFDLSVPKFDLSGNKLLDDDSELANKYADTNNNPYADQANNNEPENINTKELNRGDAIVYQVWLDTTKLTEANKINKLGITDDYDETNVEVSDIKAYDGVTGQDVTHLFDIVNTNGVITATTKDSLVKDHVIDNNQMPFGRYYKFDIVGTVKADAVAGKDFTNIANQSVQYFNPVKGGNEVPPPKPSEKRVNKVTPTPANIELKVTKRLEGGQLKGGDYTFVLANLANPDQPVQEVTNDANGNVKFSPIKYKEVGTYSYLVTEKVGTDTNVDYDTMSIVVNVDVTKNPTTGNLQTAVRYISTGGKSIGANDTEFNNTVKPPVPPHFQPEKFDLSVPKFDLTGNKLLDDDSELANKYADTNNNPYADQSNNNEPENINTKELSRGDTIVYQVWLDTTKLTAENKINQLGITDDYDETSVEVSDIKAYDGVTGQDVTHLFNIVNNNGVITATTKDSLVTDHVIDNNQMPFGRYYKFDIVGKVKADAVAGKDITNVANQSAQFFNPVKGGNEVPPPPPSEKRVNKVKPEPANIELKVTKRLEGGQLKGGDFTFVLTDLANPDQPVQQATNDANGNVKFLPIKYKEVGTHSYLVTEKVGTDQNVDYDTMSIVVNVDVTKDEATGNLKTNVKYVSTGGKSLGANDTEFNNTVKPPVPPTPVYQPEKFDLSVEKFDLTGHKLLDDDSELANKYADTNKDPYADKSNNNEPENINTKELNRGDKIVYQVWLDTTKLTAENKINKLGITDDYDETSVDVQSIKAYDGVTDQDVSHLFDIVNNNGVITATSKESLVKDHVIDNEQMPFGRYYKFDIVGTVKADAVAGRDFTNIANQSVQYFNPVKGGNEVPPPPPTEKRVNKVKPAPADIELKVTKKLEGGQLKGGDFTFVLTDLDNPNQVVQEVTNDANGIVKFSTMKYKEVGTHSYLVTEKLGTDVNVDYDAMNIVVNVNVTKDEATGNLKAAVKYVSTGGKSLGANDTEFNNTVKPPVPPTPVFQPEKFDLSVEKFDVTGHKLLDDDSELANKYADTNNNPYADQSSNNEPENINTKALNRGDKIVYQVWLDTTQLTAANKINKLGITDDYDESSVAVQSIKAYDGITGKDVTYLFDITNENGVITATSKESLVKDHVLDNEQIPFGRYYKFDIVGVIKGDAKANKDITNVANQSVQFYNPVKGGNEVPPPKPSEKRVNKVKPVPANFEFKVTKKLEAWST
ncbi:pilin isopeptide linkage protein [Staphylococcus sp. NRL 18/288]|nr:FctA domain-containing protein [Staphylococcus sp. NRL 18/288]MCJ1662999.1 pilin isopeptide linkage protein [Staphylococcus sp. NRL 18/288]